MLCNDFDPVPIRIKDESEPFHSPLIVPFLEFVTFGFDPLTSGLKKIHTDTNVAEAFVGIGIAIAHFEPVIVLSAVVMGKLNDPFTIGPILASRDSPNSIVGKKIEIKFGVRKGQFLDDFHAKKVIEFDCNSKLNTALQYLLCLEHEYLLDFSGSFTRSL